MLLAHLNLQHSGHDAARHITGVQLCVECGSLIWVKVDAFVQKCICEHLYAPYRYSA